MKRRFQAYIAKSRIALPIMSLITTIVMAIAYFRYGNLPGNDSSLWVWQWFLLAFSTYLLAELNTTQALIRIYSRMVSCAFLALIIASTFLLTDIRVGIITTSMLGIYTIMFRYFQQHQSTSCYYTSFLILGLCSLFYVEILYFVPLLWLVGGVYLLSLSGKSFISSLLGLTTPYWFAAAICFAGSNSLVGLQENLSWMIPNFDYFPNHFAKLFHFQQLFDYSNLSETQIVFFCFVFILYCIGTFSFLKDSYLDKIKTRMFYQIFILFSTVAIIFLVLQPQHYKPLMVMIFVNVSPLIGHYIALTRSRLSNIAFIVMLLFISIFAVYNLWNGI